MGGFRAFCWFLMAYFDTKTLISHPDVLQTSLLLPLKVVRLSLPSLPRAAPEGELAGGGGGGDPLVPVSPEPAVNIDGLELSRVTTFVEKITLPSTGPHGGDVIWRTKHSQSTVRQTSTKNTFEHDLGKVPVLLRTLEGDQVHAPLTAEVPTIEPVPVLELVPGLPPGEEIVVLPVLLVVLSLKQQSKPIFRHYF